MRKTKLPYDYLEKHTACIEYFGSTKDPLYLVNVRFDDEVSFRGIKLAIEKKPSYIHITKGIKSLFCIRKYKKELVEHKYNRYIFLPDTADLPFLEFVIKLIKNNGHLKGCNFSWLEYFLELKEERMSISKKEAEVVKREERELVEATPSYYWAEPDELRTSPDDTVPELNRIIRQIRRTRVEGNEEVDDESW